VMKIIVWTAKVIDMKLVCACCSVFNFKTVIETGQIGS
jgi:hypothetical protein